MRNFIKKLFKEYTKEDFLLVQDEIAESNRNVLLPILIVAGCLIFSLFLISFINVNFERHRINYLVETILIAGLFSMLYFPTKRRKLFSFITMYASIAVFSFFAISISMNQPNQQDSSFIAILLIEAAIFTDNPKRLVPVFAFLMVLFGTVAFVVKPPEISQYDILHVGIYGVLAILCNYILANLKVNSFLLERGLRHMSTFDKLTTLNNRNAYEQKLKEFEKSPFKGTIIYMDVNGLHEMNNQQGHHAGDVMLCFIARELKEFFGEEDSYRIGGDEFVILAPHKSLENLASPLKQFENIVLSEGYHISVGAEWGGQNKPINEVITCAEIKMYQAKKKYYETNPSEDRRRH